MKYTIYQITNNINGKTYIGYHKTIDINDGYMGSGKILLRAYEKYGVENFTKKILYVFDTSEEMLNKEIELVNESFVERKDTYNIKEGGFGGWDHINNDTEFRIAKNQKARKSTNKIMFERYDEHYQSELSKLARGSRTPESYKLASRKAVATMMERYGHGAFYQKKHTKETKARIGAANAIHQKGKKNSQYGTCWIHNNRVSKKIEKDDLDEHLIEGWIKGRKMKF